MHRSKTLALLRHSLRYLENAYSTQSGALKDVACFTPSKTRPFSSKGYHGSQSQQPSKRILYEGPPIHTPTPAEAAAISRANVLTASALLAVVGGVYYTAVTHKRPTVKEPIEEDLLNWSGTHECHVKRFYQPESIEEVEALVKTAHDQGQKLRCVGSGLSPNALAFEEEGMVSLSLLDKVLSVDKASGRVKVQAGARVQEVADYLRTKGLSLQNYASIREQTIGGLTQVSAHGTGAAIPPIDNSVVGLKLVTPALGTLELSKDKDPELFHLARVGLGCLGIVVEVTMQCVPAHKLLEHTFVASVKEVKANHNKWLKENKHLRYMWIPSTDAIVVVMCNELPKDAPEPELLLPQFTEEQRLAPLRSLLSSSTKLPEDEISSLSATQCRDVLLAHDPLNSSWVAKVNAAEAEYWSRSAGQRIGWSDELLGFDCGGQQWVLEVAFPTGTLSSPSGADLAYMEELLKVIKRYKIPAPAPIEQRWSSGSASPMSPCHGAVDSLFSWVGIIMYLPEGEPEQRKKITEAFKRYGNIVEEQLEVKYGAVEHWAKIEVPANDKALRLMKQRLKERYPLEEFAAARKRLDPKNILGNELIETLL